MNLVNCFLDMAYKISLNYLSFTKETFFGQNNFSNDIVDKVINKNLINIFSPKLNIAEVSKNVVHVVLSCLKSVHSDIQELARQFYPQINFCLFFKNSFTVNIFFFIQRPHPFLCD